jgi:FtsP/CotA-like multicopper oxidase with cupredoxin domain
VAGFFEKYPIKVPFGELVRTYVVNATEYEPIASFHLHAETFDVYPSGIGERPLYTTDILTLGQMERAIIEFNLSERGRYMFHPHQHRLAHRGAMGWFSAI